MHGQFWAVLEPYNKYVAGKGPDLALQVSDAAIEKNLVDLFHELHNRLRGEPLVVLHATNEAHEEGNNGCEQVGGGGGAGGVVRGMPVEGGCGK